MGLGSVSVGTIDLVVLVARSGDSASSVASLVRGTKIRSVASGEAASANGTAGGHLGVAVSVLVLILAVPEVALGRAASVVVGRTRAKALLLLVLADKEDLEESSDDEQERGDDRDGERNSVQTAGSARLYGVSEVLARAGAESA